MKKILTIQDISCFGQCSLTVALPILSSYSHETIILPTAILSTHTAFKDFTCLDLTEELLKIENHWIKQGIKFDGIYTGYMASVHQIDYVKKIINDFKNDTDVILVDPAMADNGKLYQGFDLSFVNKMKELCSLADIIVPNITEALLLLNKPYKTNLNKEEIEQLLVDLSKLGPSNVIITGVKFDDNHLGVAMYDKKDNSYNYYFKELIPDSFHGTGDIFASVFFGNYLNGNSIYDSSVLAVNFVVDSIKNTLDDKDSHWYGVHFEEILKRK